jgi:hypothetical protein
MSSSAFSQPEATRLSGNRLTIARALWLVLTSIYLVILVGASPYYWNLLLRDPYELKDSLAQIGLTLQFFVVYVSVLNYLVIVVLMVMAFLIFARKSDDWMALLVSLMMVAICAVTLPITGVLAESGTVLALFYHALRALGVGIGLAVLFTFPDGRFMPGWTSYLLALWFLNGLSWLLFPQLAPRAVPADMETAEQLGVLALTLCWFGAGLFAQIYRFNRVTDPLQRQQTKWVVFGFSMFTVGMFAVSLPILLVPALRQPGPELMTYLLIEIPFVLFCLTLVPLTIMVSILRYQLWDIDALIRRTLAYTVLTVTLAVLYFACVLVLQAMFNWIFGRSDNLALVGSTLAIAALFNPLRGRIQANIDRRFYRQKYDAEKLVRSFGASLRDEVEIDQLAVRLLQATQETLQPDGAELWMLDVRRAKSWMKVSRATINQRRF